MSDDCGGLDLDGVAAGSDGGTLDLDECFLKKQNIYYLAHFLLFK